MCLQYKGESMEEKKEKKKANHTIIGLSVAVGILGLTTLGLGIGYGITNAQYKNATTQLESVYKKNYYELADNVNSCDTNISKLLASRSDDFRAKMLNKISQSAKEMQISVASLPLTNDGILQCVKFINQMSGYTETLEQKISEGGQLTDENLATLDEMHKTLNEMKEFLNDMSNKMIAGYSIFESSNVSNGQMDDFTWRFTQISSTEYPTMIYDGPFSDSVVDQEIKGLKGETISQEEAKQKIYDVFDNVSSVKYQGETQGKFETYNFEVKNTDEQTIYIQVTKIGGKILTISGYNISEANNIDYDRAEKIALNFANKNGIKDAEVVWHQELNSQMYFNLAPEKEGVTLYPDLVKVKVDLENGNVIGFDAISYFTNHIERKLDQPKITVDQAKQTIDDSFEILASRLCLSPLDFNREVLCWEVECTRNNATFYFYINATTGVQENILKVVETSDGNKLM